MSLTLVWLLSWMAMDTLERRGAWTLMTPSGTSDCQGGKRQHVLSNSVIALKTHRNQWHSKWGKRGNMTGIQPEQNTASFLTGDSLITKLNLGFYFCYRLWSHYNALKSREGTSLVVRWPRLCAPNAEGPHSILGQGTRSHLQQLKILCAPTKTEEPACHSWDPVQPDKQIFFISHEGSETGLWQKSNVSIHAFSWTMS